MEHTTCGIFFIIPPTLLHISYYCTGYQYFSMSWVNQCYFLLRYSTDSGKSTLEYIILRRNLSSVYNSLCTTVGSKEELLIKFIELDWLGTNADPCERELVVLVLNRIEQNSHTFHDFVTLLKGISGMSSIANMLSKKFHDAN